MSKEDFEFLFFESGGPLNGPDLFTNVTYLSCESVYITLYSLSAPPSFQ